MPPTRMLNRRDRSLLEYAQPQLIELRDLCKNYRDEDRRRSCQPEREWVARSLAFSGPTAQQDDHHQDIVGLLQPTSGR